MTVKLTDFGIARAIEQTRITQVGSVVGTAAYLAPEQVRGEEATPATDVYALGVVLYQFLTGRLPYEGSTLAELAVRQQNEKPLPPSTYNDEVPETLGGAVLRALEGDPDRRYASADELAGGAAARPPGRGRDPAAGRGHRADRRARRRDRRHPPPRPAPRRPSTARRSRGTPAPGARARRSRLRPGRPPARGPPAAARRLLPLRPLRPGPGRAGPDRRRRRRRGDLATDKAAGVKVTEVAGDTIDKVVEEFKDLVKKNTE